MVNNLAGTRNSFCRSFFLRGNLDRVRILTLTRIFVQSSRVHFDCGHELLFISQCWLKVNSFWRRSDTCGCSEVRAEVLFAFKGQIVNCVTIYLTQTFILTYYGRVRGFWFPIAVFFKIRSPFLPFFVVEFLLGI